MDKLMSLCCRVSLEAHDEIASKWKGEPSLMWAGQAYYWLSAWLSTLYSVLLIQHPSFLVPSEASLVAHLSILALSNSNCTMSLVLQETFVLYKEVYQNFSNPEVQILQLLKSCP